MLIGMLYVIHFALCKIDSDICYWYFL